MDRSHGRQAPALLFTLFTLLPRRSNFLEAAPCPDEIFCRSMLYVVVTISKPVPVLGEKSYRL